MLGLIISIRKGNTSIEELVRVNGLKPVLLELIAMIAMGDVDEAVLACEYAAQLGDKDIMDRASMVVLRDSKASEQLQERVCRALKLPVPPAVKN